MPECSGLLGETDCHPPYRPGMPQVGTRERVMLRKVVRRPSEYSLQVWNMVARRGMTPTVAARHLATSAERVARIVIGVSRRNAHRW